MAIDREIEAIESATSEFDINTYTIRYDSKAKRFFKGFAPKVASGAAISTAIFAGLGVATIFTGGLGLGLAAAAGGSVAIGTAIQTAYSGIVYGRNAARSRFKALGVGGKEDDAGTIGLVEEYEKKAYGYTQMLENHPSDKTFVLSDGATYSRRDLKRRIKECEDIVYHGLKYLLDQGLYISEQITALNKKVNLTENEEDKLAKYWDVLDRIGGCVAVITSQRTEFNPYKSLIIGAIQDGCLLGNDYQNNQIKAVAASRDYDRAAELYSNMYEKPLLENIRKERQATLELSEQIKADNKHVVRTRKELIKHDRDISRVQQENRTLAKQINELDSYNLLIDVANRLTADLPNEFSEEKRAISSTTAEFKKYIQLENDAKILASKEVLDQLITETQTKLYVWYVETGKKAGLEKFKRAFEEYKEISEQKLAKQTKKYEGAVRRGVAKRAENRELRSKLDLKEAELDDAIQGWNDAEQRAEKQTKKYEGAVRRGVAKRQQAKELESELTTTQAKYERAVKRGVAKRAESKYWKDRAESAEDTVSVLYDSQVQIEAERDEAQARASKLKTKGKKATSLIATLVLDGKKKDTQIQELQSDRDELIDYNEELIADNARAAEIIVEVKEQNATLTKTNKRREGQIAKAKEKAKADAKTIAEQASQIQELSENINTFVVAQGENIQRIIDLEVENQNLEQLSRANEELAISLGHSLHQTKKELDALTSERDAYKEGVEQLEQDKLRLQQQLEEAQVRADVLQAHEDIKHNNFVRGGLASRLDKLMEKVEAHVEYTESQRKYDKHATDDLRAFIRIIKDKPEYLKTNEDLDMSIEILKKAYSVHKSSLASISRDRLKELIDSKRDGLSK